MNRFYRILLLIFFSVISFYCSFSFGQEKNIKYDHIIKFSPIDLLVNFTQDYSTIQFGYEKYISFNYSINQDIGYLIHRGSKPSILIIEFNNLSGFVSETEIRKYINSVSSDNIGRYFALHFLYRYIDAKNFHTVLDSISTESPWIYYHSKENYSTYRNEIGIHIKYGIQKVTTKSIISDVSVGIGIRLISSRTVSKHSVGSTSYEFPYHKAFDRGTKYFLSATFAVRLGIPTKRN